MQSQQTNDIKMFMIDGSYNDEEMTAVSREFDDNDDGTTNALEYDGYYYSTFLRIVLGLLSIPFGFVAAMLIVGSPMIGMAFDDPGNSALVPLVFILIYIFITIAITRIAIVLLQIACSGKTPNSCRQGNRTGFNLLCGCCCCKC
jgi:hypothetical protein